MFSFRILRESLWSAASFRHHLFSRAFWSFAGRNTQILYPWTNYPSQFFTGHLHTGKQRRWGMVLFLKHSEKTQGRFHVITLYKHTHTFPWWHTGLRWSSKQSLSAAHSLNSHYADELQRSSDEALSMTWSHQGTRVTLVLFAFSCQHFPKWAGQTGERVTERVCVGVQQLSCPQRAARLHIHA